MDYGDDSMLSAKYAQVHSIAEELTKPGAAGRIEMLRNRHKWSQRTLAELRDKGISAEMLSASGAKWSALQGKHGTDALVRFGYTWPVMLASGFTARHLSQLTHEQLTHLGISAVRALECRPRIVDICALQLTPSQLADMGWTQELLCSIGLDMQTMVGFGFPLTAWKRELGVSNFKDLGFTNYAACAAAGWHDREIQLAVNAHKPSAALKRASAQNSRTLQFL